MKILNVLQIFLFVLGIVAFLWGIVIFSWTLAGTAQSSIYKLSEWLPFPLTEIGDFVESPNGDVYVISRVFNKIIRYDRSGRALASYRASSKLRLIDARLAVTHEGVFYINISNVTFKFSPKLGVFDPITLRTKRVISRMWKLNINNQPIPLLSPPKPVPLEKLDSIVSPGEMLFDTRQKPRTQFICQDGAVLLRTKNGLQKHAPDGSILVQYPSHTWLKFFTFRQSAFLALYSFWGIVFLSVLVYLLRVPVRVDRGGIPANMRVLLSEVGEDKRRQIVMIDDASPQQKRLLLYRPWFPLGVNLAIFACMTMPGMFIFLFYMGTREEYLITIDAFTRFLIFMSLASPILFLILGLEWFMFTSFAGSTRITIDRSTKEISVIKGIVIPFSLFIEAIIQKRSFPLSETQLFMKNKLIKWGMMFQASRLYLRCGDKKIILARDYSASVRKSVFDVLKDSFPHSTTVPNKSTWFKIFVSWKAAFIVLVVGGVLAIISPLYQSKPVPLHSQVVEGKGEPLKDIPPKYVLRNFEGGASFLEFARDGETLVTDTGYYSSTYKVWDANTGALIRTVGSNQQISVASGFTDPSGFFSPAQVVIADMIHEFGLGLWNPAFGKKFSAPRELLIAGKMHASAYSTYADLLAAVEWEEDEIIHLWRLSDAEPQASLQLSKSKIEMNRLRFSPTGRLLVAEYKPIGAFLRGYEPPELTVFDLTTRTQLITLTGHRRYRISSMVFSSDETSMATGGDDKQVIVWDLSQPRNSVTFTGHKYIIKDLVYSPDEQWLVSVAGYSSRGGVKPGEIKIWNLKSRQYVATVQVSYDVGQVAFSPDGRLLAVSHGYYRQKKGEVLVWNFDDILQEAERRKKE